MNNHVFISYAREDLEFSKLIFNDLSNAGVLPWLDKESLLPGENWKNEIEKAIARCPFFLILLSSKSINKSGFVQKEIRFAFEQVELLPPSSVFIIPVRIDECSPQYDLIKDLHWVDLFPSYEDGMEKILRTIETHYKGGDLKLKLRKYTTRFLSKHKLTQELAPGISLARLSPYWTGGGVYDNSMFFGRDDYIRRLTRLEHRGFFLIGGRQSGKTSILKAVERYFEVKDNVICNFKVLAGSESCKYFMENVKGLLRDEASSPNKHVFLIDEADVLLSEDKQNKFNYLRLCEKYATTHNALFILSGYMEMFDGLLSAYSEGVNFFNAVHLKKLEYEACVNLMNMPMKRLGIKYLSPQLCDYVIHETGQRPHLISAVCDEILRNLGSRIIEKHHITSALNGEFLRMRLDTFGFLSNNERQNAINRIIAVNFSGHSSFDIGDIFQLFSKLRLQISHKELYTSLAQLEMASVLERKGFEFHYAIPILQQYIFSTYPTDSIQDLIRDFPNDIRA